ncbi:S41 family peptidase [Sphingobacterium lactis]|uniref:S41 family peptidase n=1 Tax=Sphingobacterium lactis TaxID=797291 RepID=UPI003EC5A640
MKFDNIYKKIKFKTVLLFFSFGIVSCLRSDEKGYLDKLNLNFEKNNNNYPTQWKDFGSDEITISSDSLNHVSGSFSVLLENNTQNSGFKSLVLQLPDSYIGKNITLSGSIKSENVTEGYGGLWMKINPNIAFSDMADRGVKGTTEWKEYKITLPITNTNIKNILIGGYLLGKGKLWLDNFKIYIDDKPLNDKYSVKSNFKQDKSFDENTKVDFPKIDQNSIRNLAILGRIWGFLKYHHPDVAKGKFNWDNEFFRLLPTYLTINNKDDLENYLLNWINNLGKISICERCKNNNNASLKHNLLWIEKMISSERLKNKLKEIYCNRYQGESNYVKFNPVIFNPRFINEPVYHNVVKLDAPLRLLSLFRYWNTIEFFYPYKNQTNKEWSSVLEEYIPIFLNAENNLKYELAVLRIITEINDSHAATLIGASHIDSLRGKFYAPIKLEFIENNLVIVDLIDSKLKSKNKLKVGGIITQINGKPISAILDSLKLFYPSSNEISMRRDIASDLTRSPNKNLAVKYYYNNISENINIPLYEKYQLKFKNDTSNVKNMQGFKTLNNKITYIDLSKVNPNDIPVLQSQFKNSAGIVFDIRNYPKAFVPFLFGSYFVSKPTSFVKFLVGIQKEPGEFKFIKGPVISPAFPMFKGKVVVIVNAKTQSQGEYTAMAFRSGANTTIIGENTAGADGNVSNISLPGGLSTNFSGIGVFYPNGTPTQRVGIIPDLIVKPTINGIRNGKDEMLDMAISIINNDN